MYIDKSDLLRGITAEVLDQLTGGDDLLVEAAILEAESLLRDRLCQHYDVEQIFSQVGAARHPGLVGNIRDVAIFTLYGPSADGVTDEGVQLRYDNVMSWYDRIAASEVTMDLPRRREQSQEGFSTRVLTNSDPRRRLR